MHYWLHFPSDSAESLSGFVGLYLAAGGSPDSESVLASVLTPRVYVENHDDKEKEKVEKEKGEKRRKKSGSSETSPRVGKVLPSFLVSFH